MSEDPSVSDPQVTLVLRQVHADRRPTLLWLRERLARGDAAQWLECIHGRPPTEPLDGRERTVGDAVRRATAVAAGDPAALHGADLELLDQIWEVIAAGTGAVPDICRAACLALERDAGGARGAAPTLQVGRFELAGVIGSGGSGTVYRAAHVDNGQVAAVKVLHPGLVDAEIAVRFRNEARIAARLCHPAIVKLLDSGVHERDGAPLPYVAYELIDGLPFDRALDGKPVAAILRTMEQLCDGVQHAHDAGVLHRDLKPQNVLVDAAGAPRILDFGIACSLVPAHGHAFRTLSGQVLGTPGFMSPEQAAGRKTDVRSDVWSLGAMLFHALTRALPHDLAGLGIAESLLRVAGHEPRRVRALRPDLDRDVAAVVDKAVAPEPEHRYASVADLVRDLRRLLAGDPVDARPPSAWQSLRLIARRHRVGTLGALAFFATASLGGVVTAVLWHQEVRAEERAVRLSAEALAAATGGIDMAARFAETTAAAEEQWRLLRPVLDAVTGLRPVSGVDASKWRSVESRLREVAGDLLHRSGDRIAAREQRERVLAIEEALAASGDGSAADWARAMVKLGDLDVASTPATALVWYERAHAILTDLANGPDAALRALDDLSWSFHRLAGLARTQGREVDAVTFAREHVELSRRMLGMSPDGLRGFNFATAILQLRACENRSDSASDCDLAEVAEATRRAETAVAADPGRRAYLIAAFHCWNMLGRLHLQRGEPQAAVAPVQRALALCERLHTADDDAEVRGVQVYATLRLVDVAEALFTTPPPRGDRAEAMRVLELAEARLAENPDPAAARAVAGARTILASNR